MGCVWNLKLFNDKMSQQPFHQNYKKKKKKKKLKSVSAFKTKHCYFYSSTASRNSSATFACQFIQRGYLLVHWYPIASTNKETALHFAFHSSLFVPFLTADLGQSSEFGQAPLQLITCCKCRSRGKRELWVLLPAFVFTSCILLSLHLKVIRTCNAILDHSTS